METFFSTIYYYTRFLYGVELDNYLYETVPGYYHVGLAMVMISLVVTLAFYYVFKPVRRQWAIWLLVQGLNAFLNFVVALCYTNTPLINNEVDASESWAILDTVGFGLANVIWGIIASLLISLIIKWWSPAKYIPFKIF